MFIFSAAQFEAIRTARDEGRFADAYDLIVRFATDDAGNPLEGVQADRDGASGRLYRAQGQGRGSVTRVTTLPA